MGGHSTAQWHYTRPETTRKLCDFVFEMQLHRYAGRFVYGLRYVCQQVEAALVGAVGPPSSAGSVLKRNADR